MVRERFDDHVRLSIHPSSGKEKIYIPLIPQDSFTMTPWHAAVAVDVQGNFRTAHVEELQDSHILLCKDGSPRYFVEKSPLFEWEADVEFKHQYGGVLIISRRGSSPAVLSASDKEKLSTLARSHKTLELRGFDMAESG